MERAQRALDAGGIVGEEGVPHVVSYTSRDLLLYALGVGSTADLRYLYEGAAGFAAFPTFPLVLPYKGRSCDVVPFPGELSSAALTTILSGLLSAQLFSGAMEPFLVFSRIMDRPTPTVMRNQVSERELKSA